MKTERHNSRYSVPTRIVDRLWFDDDYFRDVSKMKKNSNHSNFPKYDQWLDDDGLHLEFALAGYSEDDIGISSLPLNVIRLVSLKKPLMNGEDNKIQIGLVVRGIARRKFDLKLSIDPSFDTSKTIAKISNGLLRVLIPSSVINITNIEVSNGGNYE